MAVFSFAEIFISGCRPVKKKVNILNILIKHFPMCPVLQAEGRWLRTQFGDIGLLK
jgi:hypothetical protein